MTDLVFRGEKDIVVLGGGTCFEKTDLGENRSAYLLGRIVGQDVEELERSGDFANAYGRFVVLVHDIEKDELCLFNDRYGWIPFYQVVTKDKIYFAPQIKPFLDRGVVEKTVDYAALSNLMAFNVPMEDKTLVAGVSSVPPGIRMRISLAQHRVDQTKQWDPVAMLREPKLAYQDVKGEMIARFLEGCGKSIQGKDHVGITLSGGMDSRCLLAAALTADVTISTYNTSVPDSRSGKYASRMAAMSKAAHRFHPVGREFAARYYPILKDVMSLTEGMNLNSEAEGYWLSSHVSGPQVMLHGGMAELSKLGAMHVYFVDDSLLNADRASFPDVLWKRFEPRFHARSNYFTPAFRAQIRDQAKASMERKIARLDGLSVPEIMQVFYIEEFTKVTRCCGHLWNQTVPLDFPFSYPAYMDLLLRVHSHERMDQHFQMDLLKQTSPELFRFPNANTGIRVDASPFMKKASRYLNGAQKLIGLTKTALDHQDHITWLSHMKPAPEEVLSKEFDDTAFDRDMLEGLLASFRTAQNGAGRIRSMLERRQGWEADLQMLFLLGMWKETMGFSSFD